MGCHTFFHKKINPSYEEVKNSVIKDYKKELDIWDDIETNKNNEFHQFHECDPSKAKEVKEVILRKIRMIEADLCQKAMYRRYEHGNELTHYSEKNGLYICSDDLPHDIFRVGHYPDDELFSLEETLEYIKNNEDKVYFSYDKEIALEELKKYWEKNPNGMICFG